MEGQDGPAVHARSGLVEDSQDVSRSGVLRKAALEHRRLITPGPDLAAAIEAALQLHPRMRRERTEDLSDPWWRAMSYEWNGIAEYHARNSYAGVARRTESSTIPSQKAASSASHSQRKAPFATISPERSSG